MNEPAASKPQSPRKRGPWLVLAFLFAVALFMYVSIMIKIIKYGA